MTTPQPVPVAPPTPVGQPVSPVDFFRRMPGGGTAYVKSPSEADVLTEFYFRCGCDDPSCNREGYTLDVVEHLTAERDTEITRLRVERDDLRGVVTRLTDQLVYLLAAADQTWSAETGDETSSPDYIRHLADGVTALHEPPVAARPDCGHPDCACCRNHSSCRDGCGNCTESAPSAPEGGNTP